MRIQKLSILILALGLLGNVSYAQEQKVLESAVVAESRKDVAFLSIGDVAPPLAVKEWLKGSPVSNFEPGKTYVITFWTTWAAPAVESIPHLTDLQMQYGDKLTVIGVSAEDMRTSVEKVKNFLAERGDGADYTFAMDDEYKTTKSYMSAAKQDELPCSFIVNGAGKIAYIGHPVSLDRHLAEVIAGTYDMAAAKARHESAMQAEAGLAEYVRLADAGKLAEATTLAKTLVKDTPLGDDAAFLNRVAWNIVDPKKMVKGGDFDFALECAMMANKFTEDQQPGILDTLAHALAAKGDYKQALEIEGRAIELAKEGPMKEELKKSMEGLVSKAGQAEGTGDSAVE